MAKNDKIQRYEVSRGKQQSTTFLKEHNFQTSFFTFIKERFLRNKKNIYSMWFSQLEVTKQ